MSTATIESDSTECDACLYMSMELGEGTWKLGFTTGFGEKLTKRRVASRDVNAVLKAIASVRKSLGLEDAVEVRSGYEAGRDGFWLHRFLISHGINNLVMDSSSIEVSRRGRRPKTDDLDTADSAVNCRRFGFATTSGSAAAFAPALGASSLRSSTPSAGAGSPSKSIVFLSSAIRVHLPPPYSN